MYKSYNDHTTTAHERQEGNFNSDGTVQNLKEKALSRTYILYYQGIPKSFKFDENNKNFEAEFTYDKKIKNPSVIYLNKNYYYKNGYDLKIMDKNNTSIDGVEITEEGNYINFFIDNTDGIEVKVNLIAL